MDSIFVYHIPSRTLETSAQLYSGPNIIYTEAFAKVFSFFSFLTDLAKFPTQYR